MHTTITQSEPTIADLQKVMIRIQIAALETMERCMQDPESTGDEKKDKAESTKLNRQRMAAAQTLTHCRTMFREIREAEAQQHRIAEEKKQSAKKAIFDLASLRRLHKTYPGEYDNPYAPSHAQTSLSMPPEPSSLDAVVGAEGAGHADNSSPKTPSHGLRSAPAMPPKPIPTDIGKALAAQIIALAGTTQNLNTTPR